MTDTLQRHSHHRILTIALAREKRIWLDGLNVQLLIFYLIPIMLFGSNHI
jgi:hypothetical protein